MSSTHSPGTRVDTRLVLERARTALAVRRQAEVEVLESVLDWAHAHPAGAQADAAGWRADGIATPGSYAEVMFGEQAVPIAGPGAPLVAEFCVHELAAALDLSHEATLAMMGDVLDLAHRLPRLWALVRSGRVPVRVGREAARSSRDLDVDAAAHADRLLVWQPRRLNPHRVAVLVHEARLYADPDRAIADHDAALASRKVDVRLGPDVGAPGTGEVFMVLDEADTIAFDHTVSTMAATIGILGHPGSLDVRRAHAVGLLADPQAALDLLAGVPSDRDAEYTETSEATCVAEDLAHDRANPFRRPLLAPADTETREGTAGEVRLVLHVTDRDLLDDPHGVAHSPRLGPVLVGRLRSWLLTAGQVTITPVVDLDPAAHPPVDRHDPPSRMAVMVRHRDRTCVFPRCGRLAEACDLDHIDPYVPVDQGGPPGQTHPGNLAPLCRRHHRAKTFGEFSYRRLPDGSYQWTLPTGTTITTDVPVPRPQPPPRRTPPHRRT